MTVKSWRGISTGSTEVHRRAPIGRVRSGMDGGTAGSMRATTNLTSRIGCWNRRSARQVRLFPSRRSNGFRSINAPWMPFGEYIFCKNNTLIDYSRPATNLSALEHRLFLRHERSAGILKVGRLCEAAGGMFLIFCNRKLSTKAPNSCLMVACR